MKKISTTVFYIIVSLLIGCIKPFIPSTHQYENLLVVDGYVTDGPGPYTITLSKSGEVKQFAKPVPVSNCQVKVRDNYGNEYIFYEKQPGIYLSDSANFRGIPGRSYQLLISTSDGESIASTMDVLKTGVGIQSIDPVIEHRDDPALFYGRDGYRFYITSEPFNTKDNYFMWRLQTTYKFRADYGIFSYIDTAGHYSLMSHGDTLRTCYRNVDVLEILLLNTTNLNTTQINHYPLYYEDNYSKALTVRYSLNVLQYKINEAAFEYWNEIKKMTDNGGDLYSAQPYQVKNNLKNNSHPEIAVLGYFTVAGVSEKRIFLNRPPIIFRYETCHPGTPQMFIVENMLDRPDLWPVYFAETEVGMYLLDQECVNCLKTGTQTKPAFWVE